MVLPQVDQTIEELLNRGYEQTTRSVLSAILSSTTNEGGLIQRRLKELDDEVERLNEEGRRLTPDNATLRALLSDMEAALRGSSRQIGQVSGVVQANASQAAGAITRQLALPGFSDDALRVLGIRWNSPDPEAVNTLVGYVESEAWANELRRYPQVVVDVVRNQAIQSVTYGWSANRTVEEIRRLTETLPVARANTILRTLHNQSYSTATALHQNANIAIIDKVIRIAALSDRTCLACWSLHGTVIWDRATDEGKAIPRVIDHHNGRCTSITQVIGLERIVEPGEDVFNRLPERRKLAIAGPGKLAALNSGQATLADFVTTYQDPVFGELVRAASLSSVVE